MPQTAGLEGAVTEFQSFEAFFFSLENLCKVEKILEQREVAFLSPSKICENLNFSTGIQIFTRFAG